MAGNTEREAAMTRAHQKFGDSLKISERRAAAALMQFEQAEKNRASFAAEQLARRERSRMAVPRTRSIRRTGVHSVSSDERYNAASIVRKQDRREMEELARHHRRAERAGGGGGGGGGGAEPPPGASGGFRRNRRTHRTHRNRRTQRRK